MRLISYSSSRGQRAGVLRGDRVIDIWDALGGGGSTLRELLASGRIEEVEDIEAEGTRFDELELLVPIPDPDKIICIGLNYSEHAAEAGLEPPASPTFFAKFRNAPRADGATVELPRREQEGRLRGRGRVRRRPARQGRQRRPMRSTTSPATRCFNDLSARDLQFATPQWMPGKVFDGSAPCGPALVTPDEAGPADAIGIALDLNGERMQEATTADLIFSVAELVAHLSRLMTLEPGDIVATGTPAGVGGAREPASLARARRRDRRLEPQLGELRPASRNRRATASRSATAKAVPGAGALTGRDRTRSGGSRRDYLLVGGEEVDQHERHQPDDVEVEPVGRADLGCDQHRGAERGDLNGRPAARKEDDADRERDDGEAHQGLGNSSEGSRPQTLNGEPRDAW